MTCRGCEARKAYLLGEWAKAKALAGGLWDFLASYLPKG